MARITYLGITLISILTGYLFYGAWRERFDTDFLIPMSLLPMLLFATGVHGFIAHSASSALKSRYGVVFYTLLMGMILVVLFIIHFFVVLPLVCPEFLGGRT